MRRLFTAIVLVLLGLGGCAELEAGSVHVLAVRPAGLWIARDGKSVRDGHSMQKMVVIYYCTDPGPNEHPVCRSAWYRHSTDHVEALWPSGVGLGKK